MKKICIVLLIMVLSLSMLTACSNNSEDKGSFPEKPIDWIVAYPAGSPADTTSRLLAQYAEKYLPNDGKFVIVNKPGAAGSIGMTDVYNAEPDGYTIGTTAMAAMSIKPHLDAKYEHDGFDPIINYVDAQQLLFVPWDSPFKTLDDILQAAKERKITFGTSGAMNAVHVGLETFAQEVDANLEAVPYNGEPEVINALLRGDIDSGSINGPNSYQYFESKQLRPIFNYTPVRNPFPDVPTLKELGYNTEILFFNGVMAPKGVPEDRMEILVDAFLSALDDPELKQTFEERSISSNPLVRDEFQKVITDLYNSFEPVLKNMGEIK